MGYYTGFKYKVKLKPELKDFFIKGIAKDYFDITDLPISKVPPRYLSVWLDFIKNDRPSWMIGGGSVYFDNDDWKTGYSLSEDGVFYSSGSLKDYDDTIEAFTKVLPLLGDEWIIMSVGEDWIYGDDLTFDVDKSENCTLAFDLLGK